MWRKNVLVAVCLYLYGEKVKESLKKIWIWGGWGKKKKMGKDECQIGANLRDDNTLYYNTCHIGCSYAL